MRFQLQCLLHFQNQYYSRIAIIPVCLAIADQVLTCIENGANQLLFTYVYLFLVLQVLERIPDVSPLHIGIALSEIASKVSNLGRQ